MNLRSRFFFLLITMMVSLTTPLAASGFGIYDQGVQSTGAAGAVVARAEDASAVFHNPAGLAQLPYQELAFSVRPHFSKSFYSNAGQTTFDSEGSIDALPSLFYAKPMGRFGLGLATTTTNHFRLDWDEPDFPGRFLSRGSEFLTQDILAGIGFRLTDAWSIGLSYRYVLADYNYDRVLNRPIDGNADPLFFETHQKVETDGDGTGFIFGIQYYPGRKFSIGASYQSAVDLDLDGNSRVSQLTRLNDQRAVDVFNNSFNDTNALTAWELPERIQVGFATKVTVRTRIEFDVSREDWSGNQTQVISVGGENIVEPRGWEEVYSYRLNGDFQQRKALLWRIGLANVRRAMPSETVEPSFPDGDRFSYSFGVSYTYQRRYILEAAILYTQNRDRQVTNLDYVPSTETDDFVIATGESGTFETQRWQFNLGARIRFGVPTD
ncbi:OmpP1/FadL family transporter [Acanthopleuribacter pedis]|uniref:Outer membrane protein transport protein n=1 Tax=Acanthopleuribacter pedis TaxID=442870 RepID=A0A8J7QE82_9BACT|nr:outer membrane protein transport protein [Acanthopleuribacter pedis]MBO1318035.1 outer membrane protein transport protein [Acanthopleuribacter pedis]